jgi:hypothetical protein
LKNVLLLDGLHHGDPLSGFYSFDFSCSSDIFPYYLEVGPRIEYMATSGNDFDYPGSQLSPVSRYSEVNYDYSISLIPILVGASINNNISGTNYLFYRLGVYCGYGIARASFHFKTNPDIFRGLPAIDENISGTSGSLMAEFSSSMNIHRYHFGLGIDFGYRVASISAVKSDKSSKIYSYAEGEPIINDKGKNLSLNFNGSFFGVHFSYVF